MYFSRALDLLFGNNRSRRSARNDTQKIIPSASDTSSVSFNEFLERDGHFFFNSCRVVDMSRNVEKLRARIPLSAETYEPRTTAPADTWSYSYSFYVGYGCWAPENSNISWEWWLQSRLSLLSFNGFNQSSFFSTDISTSSTVHEHRSRIQSHTRSYQGDLLGTPH